jgi:NADPH:quinone reductase-like Zn-dependent oxidoreductase
MKAMVYTRYGPPEVLHLADVPKPVPRRHEVLIRVRATTVSVADVRCRAFRVPLSFWILARLSLGVLKPRRSILGGELAGDVEEIGQDVVRFKKGDAVFAETLTRPGAYAEYTCLPETGVIALKPTNMTYEEAAAVPIGARAALHYLRRAHVASGQRVLVYGASGSVGTFAVQLAKYFGAHVTAVCSGSNLDLVKSLGADAVIDYTTERFAAGGNTYDVILVAVNRCSFADCMRALKEKGIYLNVTTPIRTLRMWWAALTSHKTIITGEMADENGDDLVFLHGLIARHQLRAVIDRRYPLEQLADAHRYVDDGHKKGNVVITVAAATRVTPPPSRVAVAPSVSWR